MEYFTEFILKRNQSRENAVHLNFKQRLATNEEKKKKKTHILPLEFLTGKLFFRKDGMSFPCNFLFHCSSLMMQKAR